jgi:hypothetical protein
MWAVACWFGPFPSSNYKYSGTYSHVHILPTPPITGTSHMMLLRRCRRLLKMLVFGSDFDLQRTLGEEVLDGALMKSNH